MNFISLFPVPTKEESYWLSVWLFHQQSSFVTSFGRVWWKEKGQRTVSQCPQQLRPFISRQMSVPHASQGSGGSSGAPGQLDSLSLPPIYSLSYSSYAKFFLCFFWYVFGCTCLHKWLLKKIQFVLGRFKIAWDSALVWHFLLYTYIRLY